MTAPGRQDLLQKLYELSRAIAADFARFETLTRDDSPKQASPPSETLAHPGLPQNEQNHL
jgi:hypothetical protein